jgi:hypothetical protein
LTLNILQLAGIATFSVALFFVYVRNKIIQKRNVKRERGTKDTGLYERCLLRHSTRIFNAAVDIPENIQGDIKAFLSNDEVMTGPFKNRIIVDFVSLKDGSFTGKLGSYGNINGASYFVIVRKKNDTNLVDIGYVFERVILYLTELGLDTCWMGMFNKKRLGPLVKLNPGEELTFVSPVGYVAKEVFFCFVKISV